MSKAHPGISELLAVDRRFADPHGLRIRARAHLRAGHASRYADLPYLRYDIVLGADAANAHDGRAPRVLEPDRTRLGTGRDARLRARKRRPLALIRGGDASPQTDVARAFAGHASRGRGTTATTSEAPRQKGTRFFSLADDGIGVDQVLARFDFASGAIGAGFSAGGHV